jgi:phosphoribosylaminoimidazole-succinocarboxamide synthase
VLVKQLDEFCEVCQGASEAIDFVDDDYVDPPSLDIGKQFLRDWLQQQPWDKTPPPPTLPQDIIGKTAARYREALERLVAG